MTSLESKLKRIRAQVAQKASAEAKETMERATRELRESGIMDRIPEVGDELPPFELPVAAHGNSMSSRELLEKGPLVLTFYRGVW